MARVREILLPWDSQPQEAVELAPEFRDNFASAWLPNAGLLPRDLIGSVHMTGVADSGKYSFGARAAGVGIVGDGNTSAAAKGAFSTASFAGTSSDGHTSVAVVTFDAFTASTESAIFRCTPDPASAGIAIGWFANTKTFRPLLDGPGWGTGNDTADTTIVAGVPWVIAMHYDRTTWRVYSHRLGSPPRVIRTFSATAAVGGTGPMYLGGLSATGSSAAFPGAIHFFAAGNKKTPLTWFEKLISDPWANAFAPQTIPVPVSAGGGPSNYPVTLSESATSADACSVMIGFAPIVAETVTALDTSSQLAALSKSIAETAAALDTALAVVARAGTVAETTAAADSASAVAAFAKTLAESGTAVDTVNGSAAGDYAGTVTEAGSAADASSQVASMAASITEAGSAADASSNVASLSATAAETASAADTTSGTTTGDYAGTVTEAGSAIDTQSNVASLSATTIEAASAADVAAASRAVAALIAEAMSAVDSASASSAGDYFGIVAEAGAAVDTASQAAAMFGTVAESASAMDSAYVFNAWLASITESATAADVVSQVLNAVYVHSAWWLYVVPTDNMAYAVPADDLSFAVSASSLAYRTGV